jgi:integrating conjugative element protein (TIGR03757 family)
MLFGSTVCSATAWAGEILSIETFSTADRPVIGVSDNRLRTASITNYAIDGLKRFEAHLSEGLSNDPEVAKSAALRRIQAMDDADMAPAEHSAIGLAKAVQYGIDRHPAIVFNGRAVVYGLTNLTEAVVHYRRWQKAQAR